MNFTLETFALPPGAASIRFTIVAILFLLFYQVGTKVVNHGKPAGTSRASKPLFIIGMTGAIAFVTLSFLSLVIPPEEPEMLVTAMSEATSLTSVEPVSGPLRACSHGAKSEVAYYSGLNSDSKEVSFAVRRGAEIGGSCEYTVTVDD